MKAKIVAGMLLLLPAVSFAANSEAQTNDATISLSQHVLDLKMELMALRLSVNDLQSGDVRAALARMELQEDAVIEKLKFHEPQTDALTKAGINRALWEVKTDRSARPRTALDRPGTDPEISNLVERAHAILDKVEKP